jgi:YD repeat-containing protein
MNCSGCGVDLDPSPDQINDALDQVLEASLKDAEKRGGVCPLCGHSKEIPYSHRKSVQFGLLVLVVIIAATGLVVFGISRQTARSKAADEVLARLNQSPAVTELLGQPLKIGSGIDGEVRQDETGWSEAHLTLQVAGPKATATVKVIGGREAGPWTFTTLEAIVMAERKRVDLITGRISDYDPAAYIETHTQAALEPANSRVNLPAPRMDGNFPCIFASVGKFGTPQLGHCAIPLPMESSLPVDRYEVDLRYGSFILRQTDLMLKDAINVPLTRTYNSYDWMHPNPVHAFGRNANHLFDIAPVGSRNPYTFQFIVLGDGNWLYFDRISKGTGYADAVFEHAETSTSFYGAITRWDGKGWTTQLRNGGSIFFPESYNAKNMAQGAAWTITDKNANKVELVRDAKRDLQAVRAPRGGSITFKYDNQSRVVRAEDNAGHWATYQYNTAGMLTDVKLSSGVERHYTYAGYLMTSIRDERDRFLVQNFYGNAFNEIMLDRQQTEAGTYSYRYELSPNRQYVIRVAVTFPDGSTKIVEPQNSVPAFIRNLH